MNKSSFNRLIIVAYRLPFTLQQSDSGLTLKQNSGGLVSAVLSMAERAGHSTADAAMPIHWVGHAEPVFREIDAAELANSTFVAHPVFLDEAVNRGFYEGFSNNLLWPLFHYFPSYASFQEADFQHYQQANARFLEELAALIQPGDLIWIHDFQLMLLPELVRQALPQCTIGYFFHIPFPNHEMIRLLPRVWRQTLLQGVLGADVVGFHTADYVQHFFQSVAEFTTFPVIDKRVILPNRSVVVSDFAISVDFAKFDSTSQEPAVVETRQQYQTLLRHNQLIFSVDRLDYTKGISYRLQGYELFLIRHPEWHDRVTFVMTVVPSRDKIGHYQELKREIEETVGRINGLFGTIGWRPIVYSYTSLTFTELLALYTACNVALITPVRDGMNLVCKEFIASRHDEQGVLILSELAGAAKELHNALIINPTDTQEVADAIHQSLTMPVQEQRTRMRQMRHHLQNHNVFRWNHDFLQAINQTQQHRPEMETDLSLPAFLRSFSEADRRLLLLDFDGTLAPIVDHPADARPSPALCQALGELAGSSDVVVISGRNRAFLETIFTGIPLYLVAEHGAFLKKPDQAWERLDLTTDNWLEPVRAVMQQYAARTDGTFVEEKETALVWHYRLAKAGDIEVQATQLAATLRGVGSDVPLTVIQGNKVVEVKPARHSKGTVALSLAEQKPYTFIVSIGDDTTDEDMFSQLPNWSYTLKVGAGPSFARYRLAHQRDVETLLQKLSETLVSAS